MDTANNSTTDPFATTPTATTEPPTILLNRIDKEKVATSDNNSSTIPPPPRRSKRAHCRTQRVADAIADALKTAAADTESQNKSPRTIVPHQQSPNRRQSVLPNRGEKSVNHQNDNTSTFQLSVDGWHSCRQCPRRFRTRHAAECHRREEHCPNLPVYSCDQCSFRHFHRSYMKVHARVHSGERPYKCAECTRDFSVLHNLRMHELTHGDAEDKWRFICDICSKGFTFRRDFNDHFNSHTGARPYRCERCGRRYATRSGRSRHRRKAAAGRAQCESGVTSAKKS